MFLAGASAENSLARRCKLWIRSLGIVLVQAINLVRVCVFAGVYIEILIVLQICACDLGCICRSKYVMYAVCIYWHKLSVCRCL